MALRYDEISLQKIGQNIPMRLDHVSYVCSQNELLDTVNRLGRLIQTSFVDGGIHPRFGTRNFTAPLLNNQYVEIVCPMDHPATDQTPFGKAVKQKSEAGGGWLTWVISTNDLSPIEKTWSRKAVIGTREMPDGTKLEWKQIGVMGTLDNPIRPFFVQWLSSKHPSSMGSPKARIKKLQFLGNFSQDDLITKTNISNLGIQIENLKEISSPEKCLKSVEFDLSESSIEID